MAKEEKELTPAEIWYGFLRTPPKFKKILPAKGGKLDFKVNGEITKLNYHPRYSRIFGLTSWYKKLNIKSGKAILSGIKGEYRLVFKKV